MTMTLQQFAIMVVAGFYVPMVVATSMIFRGAGLRKALFVALPIAIAIFVVPRFLGYR